jgi:hypothetical protein
MLLSPVTWSTFVLTTEATLCQQKHYFGQILFKKNQVTVVCGFLHQKCNASLITPRQSNGSESVLVTLFPFTHPTVTSKSLSIICTTVIGFYIFCVILTITITVQNKFALQIPRHRTNLQIEIMWVTRIHNTHTSRWKYYEKKCATWYYDQFHCMCNCQTTLEKSKHTMK